MILEIETGAQKATPTAAIEFLTLQLMPLADGLLGASLKLTTFDEKELELIDQEIVDERVASLDQLFALVRAHVRVTTEPLDHSVGQPQ
jgi:hypothetical protein